MELNIAEVITAKKICMCQIAWQTRQYQTKAIQVKQRNIPNAWRRQKNSEKETVVIAKGKTLTGNTDTLQPENLLQSVILVVKNSRKSVGSGRNYHITPKKQSIEFKVAWKFFILGVWND